LDVALASSSDAPFTSSGALDSLVGVGRTFSDLQLSIAQIRYDGVSRIGAAQNELVSSTPSTNRLPSGATRHCTPRRSYAEPPPQRLLPGEARLAVPTCKVASNHHMPTTVTSTGPSWWALASLITLTAAGCTHVAPYERERADLDCAENETSVPRTRICVMRCAEGVTEHSCPDSAPTCDEVARLCVQCKSDQDCRAITDDGDYCKTESGSCVHCTDDRQCPATRPRCDQVQHRCAECSTSPDVRPAVRAIRPRCAVYSSEPTLRRRIARDRCTSRSLPRGVARYLFCGGTNGAPQCCAFGANPGRPAGTATRQPPAGATPSVGSQLSRCDLRIGARSTRQAAPS
jgi:hypothetical protein